jgi:hypothetical protein
MKLKPEDYLKMKFNVQGIPEKKDLFSAFPELKRYEEFFVPLPEPVDTVDRNQLLRYIFLCYDKGSPYVRHEPNLSKRKVMCALEAGFTPKNKKGEFGPQLQAVMANKVPEIRRMINRFCRVLNDMGWILLVSSMENFYLNTERLTDPEITEENKTKVSVEALKKQKDYIEQLAEEVFTDDIEIMFTADEVYQEETGDIKSYPEYIASIRKTKKNDTTV